MNRAFLSLYFFIVVSVIFLGWTTERLWQRFVPDAVASADQAHLMQLLFSFSKGETLTDIKASLTPVEALHGFQLVVYELDDFGRSGISKNIHNNELVFVNDSADTQILYQKFPKKPFILSLKTQRNPEENKFLYSVLIVLFYTLLAAAIYLWVWPLTRDLKVLQNAARKLGENAEMAPVELHASSAVYDLAAAFNIMSDRIHSLLNTQKLMTHAISHELRTPLARMKFSLAAVADDASEAFIEKAVLDDILAMETLISEFLNYSSFDQQNHCLDQALGELEPMVAMQVARLVSSKRVDIHNHLLDGNVTCCWQLMEHALQNVIQNGARYAAENIVIALHEDKQIYEIRVADDGGGIPNAEKSKVFDAFYRRADPVFSQQGFGLGLALVKRILMWHGGDASVEDSQLGGACFILRWPKRV